MAYDAKDIANWFVRRAKEDGRSFSIMSLLKLAYIAHGWRLEMTGAPLFNNKIEAWQYGPVVRDVYNSFRKQGVTVTSEVPSVSAELEADVVSLLEQVYTNYGNLSAFQLSDITHVVGGPWDIATRVGGNYAEIPNELIQQHYQAKRAAASRVASNG